MERLRPLLANTYRYHYLAGMGLRANYLHRCRRLAGYTAVRTITWTDDLGPAEGAGLLLADLEAA